MEINNAYTGERQVIDPDTVVSLESLKTQLSKSSNVDIDHMLLLIAPGASQLRLDKCVNGQVVFLYDRQLIAARSMTQSRLEYSTQLPDVYSKEDIHKTVGSVSQSIATIDQATQLALAHMNAHLRSLARSLRSKLETFRSVRDDAAACSDWRRVWDALHQLRSVDASVIPDKSQLSAAWSSLQVALNDADSRLQRLDAASSSVRARAGELLTQMAAKPILPAPGTEDLRQWMVAKRRAQDRLCDVLREIASVQHRLGEDLRPQLAEVSTKLIEADEHKTTVAAVIDIPFLQGAVLVDKLRRSRWLAEFEAQAEASGDRLTSMREQELERIDQWNRHYSKNSLMRVLGAEMEDSLLPPGVEALSSSLKKYANSSSTLDTQRSQQALAQLDAYLDELKNAGLSDTYTDLKFELDAMTAEMADQLSRSSTSGLKAKYEARIRQLENTLLQVRMETTPPPPPTTLPPVPPVPLEESTPDPAVNPAAPGVVGAGAVGVVAEPKETGTARATNTSAIDLSTGLTTEAGDGSIAESNAETARTHESGGYDPEFIERATKISEQLWHNTRQFEHALNGMGLQSSIGETGDYEVHRVKGLGKNPPPEPEVPSSVRWAQSTDQTAQFAEFEKAVSLDYGAVREGVARRFGEIEKLARKLQTESRQLRERTRRAEHESRQRLALHSFRSGDLILFLPTRGQNQNQQQLRSMNGERSTAAVNANPWAAFNAGAPHYFLQPDQAKKLLNREYLIARAATVEPQHVEPDSSAESNPFGLATGTEWYLITVQGEWDV